MGNEWSNEVLLEDDEKTIKLKQRLSRAELELDAAREEANSGGSFAKRGGAFARNRKDRKYSDIVVNPNAKGLARFGYDERAHEAMKSGKGYIESSIENPKARMALYIVVSIVGLAVIIAKLAM